MIDIGIYAALGFFVASLLALLLVPPLWNRAVRLTTRRLEATMPMSIADIQADKDQQRAEYAIELRRVEVALERAKEKATHELVEANKRRTEIGDLKAEIEKSKARLQERENANRVLEQTIRRRLPELEGRLKAAKETIAALETANHELRSAGANQAEALRVARSTLSHQRGDIDQLRGALEVEAHSSRRSSKSDTTLTKENRRLSAELSKLKEELVQEKIGDKENELLRRELGKLSQQILAVAEVQGTRLPDEAAMASRAMSFAPHLRRAEPAPAFMAGNGGASERYASQVEASEEQEAWEEEAPAVQAPEEEVPAAEVPEEAVPATEIPEEAAPAEEAFAKEAPEAETPMAAHQDLAIPADMIEEREAALAASEERTHAEHAATEEKQEPWFEAQAPEEQTAEEQTPEEQVSEEQVPEERVPEGQVPEEQAYIERVPEEQVYQEQASEEEQATLAIPDDMIADREAELAASAEHEPTLQDMAEDVASAEMDEEAEEQDPIAVLSARGARKRSRNRRPASLSERLKNVTAEASDF